MSRLHYAQWYGIEVAARLLRHAAKNIRAQSEITPTHRPELDLRASAIDALVRDLEALVERKQDEEAVRS